MLEAKEKKKMSKKIKEEDAALASAKEFKKALCTTIKL